MNKLATFFASIVGRLLLALVAIGAILFGLHQCQTARRAGSEAALSAQMGKAASDDGKDAVGVVGAVSGRNSASDDLTRENEDAIRNAPGAATPVDPGVRDAGLAGLCRRAAYRDSEKCLQRPVAGGVAPGGAGRAAP
ncbi:hypothetical protein [Novosphingobium sp. BL-52-GroH]|uniref:hypothetical protein n=1 Tax=Novosphingobium sp. BL-52-GroH TaxID=3349877 RepID=UPI00384E3D22